MFANWSNLGRTDKFFRGQMIELEVSSSRTQVMVQALNKSVLY